MKVTIVILLIALVASQECDAEKGFPETPAGEMAYIDCEPDEWGYVAKFCSTSQTPIWIDIADTCTPKKKLINPPYGSNMVEYEIEFTNFSRPFTPKHKYLVDNALFNFTYEYVVKETDVLVIDVKYDTEKDNETVIITVHQRLDFVYRQKVIELIKEVCNNGDLIFHLQELDDDFLDADLFLKEDSFRFRGFNIFLNPWFQMIFGTFIVCVIWAIICRICRKRCGKKDPLLESKV